MSGKSRSSTCYSTVSMELTSSKWAKLTKSSQDTAYRDIVDLVERGALQKDPSGGRSTSYSLVIQ